MLLTFLGYATWRPRTSRRSRSRRSSARSLRWRRSSAARRSCPLARRSCVRPPSEKSSAFSPRVEAGTDAELTAGLAAGRTLDARDRDRREGASEDVDEQRARPGPLWKRPLQDVHRVGELVALEMRLAEHDHRVLWSGPVLLEERQDRIRRVDREAVLVALPELDETVRGDVADFAAWTICEVDGRIGETVQRHGPLFTGRARRALDEQRVDPLQRSFRELVHRIKCGSQPASVVMPIG